MFPRAKQSLILFIAVALLSLGFGARAGRAADDGWHARYWNNRDMSGAPVLERHEGATLDYNWGAATPAGPGVKLDNFSAEWTRTVNIDRAGTYRFDAQVDDGVRVYVDDVLVVDEWKLGSARTVSGERYLTAGDHELKVLYFDAGVVARIGLTWSFVSPWPTVFDGWKGEYFNNRTLSGAPTLVRDDSQINFAWKLNSPGANVPADHFSARWTRTLNLPAGTYSFRVYSDDGVRLWVGDKLLIDRWNDQSLNNHRAEIKLPGGNVNVRMEYYEREGDAFARLDWIAVGSSISGSGWTAEYFNNRRLAGLPTLVRKDDGLMLNFDWGTGAPATGIGSDHFSVRWTRDLTFTPGRHRFTVRTDDGVRLWVNNRLLIDRWNPQSATSHSASIDLPGGVVPVRMEYFEHEGDATAFLSWSFVSWSDGDLAVATVKSRNLNIRSGPGTSHRILDNVEQGTELELVGYRDESAEWVMVLVPGKSTQAWVYAPLLNMKLSAARLSIWPGSSGNPAPSPGTMVATVNSVGKLNVRSGPGFTNSVITTVDRGTTLEMVGYRSSDSLWVMIKLPTSGRQAWVYAPLVTTTVPVTSLPVWTTGNNNTNAPTGTVTARYLNVRSGPGTSHSIISYVSRDETVSLLGRNADASWLRVTSSKGKTGWVSARYVESTTSFMSLPRANN